MSNTKAFTVNIGPKGSGEGENNSVHQSSPAWVLTFVRWENRDTLRIKSNSFSEVRHDDPLVVENDCLSVSTGMNKGSLTPNMNATLLETDTNYLTAVAPGDFVFVNMLNWESDAKRVAKQARSSKPINGKDDGFKGIFKVQSVRKIISVNQENGAKTVLCKIDGYGFTEFNNTIYFNQNLLASGDEKNFSLFANNLGTSWSNLVNARGSKNVQDIIAILIQCFIGSGFNTKTLADDLKKSVPTPNVHFFIPQMVASLLGIKHAKAAKDIYDYLFGVQTYSTNSNQTLASGLNPTMTTSFSGVGFHYTKNKCKGDTVFKPEFWNGAKAWGIINQYTNAPLNEIFTCFRINKGGHIMPTVVFRQIPFTTEDFQSRTGIKTTVTKFLNLPRWHISPAMVFSADIGRDEAARVNFVQFYARTGLDDKGAGLAQETAKGNYVFDIGDVQRSGLRPSIISNSFDAIQGNVEVRSPVWAKIVGDALIGSHLKLNGTLECVGIIEPITIGDNLQFDNVVYQIESVINSCGISPGDGRKQFRTIIKLSSGVSLDSVNVTKYAEMTHTSGYKDRQDDSKNGDGILPGVSESQNTLSRTKNLDNVSNPDAPFPQPGSKSKTVKRKR